MNLKDLLQDTADYNKIPYDALLLALVNGSTPAQAVFTHVVEVVSGFGDSKLPKLTDDQFQTACDDLLTIGVKVHVEDKKTKTIIFRFHAYRLFSRIKSLYSVRDYPTEQQLRRTLDRLPVDD